MKLGQLQTLEIAKTTDFGIYLKDIESNREKDFEKDKAVLTEDKVLLPKNQSPVNCSLGDKLQVFIYKDSEDRPIATTTIPPLTIGGIAKLTVKQVTPIGAFLDWGLPKDLLLPFKEQTLRVQEQETVLVSLYIDKSQRLCATMKLYEYLSTDSNYKKDDKVTGIVYEIIDSFGAFVAVDNQYSALIPKKDLHKKLVPGECIEARVILVHEDGKLALSLREKAHLQMDDDGKSIYEKLIEAGGFLPYHDKSEAGQIQEKFEISKNAFKRAIGHLMKDGKITIHNDGIRIVSNQ